MTVPFKLAFSAFILSTALVACPAGAPPADTTPPTITGHTPGVNAINVSVRDPISVTFSKAIKASSINGDSVLLGGAGGGAIARTASLSADGRTLSVMPVSLTSVPNTLTLALTAAVTDTSGNALAPASWSWTLPDWLPVGGALNAVSGHVAGRPFLALDAAGKPVVSFTETDGTSTNVYTWRWTGGAWQALGGALNPTGGDNASLNGLVVDASDHPIVSLTEYDGAHVNLYVQRWDGSAWQAVGSPINPTGLNLMASGGLALLNGNPVTVIQEFDGANYNAYVQAWTGSAWQALGAPINPVAGRNVYAEDIAVNPAGALAVAVQESDNAHVSAYVSRWDGSKWQPVGGVLNAVTGRDVVDGPFIALDAAGNPAVAFSASIGVQEDTYAFHWTGSSWLSLGAGVPTGGGSSRATGVAVDGAGNVVVATFMYGSSLDSGRVQRWNGSAWQAIGSNITGPGGSTAIPSGLVLDAATGAPVIAYQAAQDGVYDAFVTRYNQ